MTGPHRTDSFIKGFIGNRAIAILGCQLDHNWCFGVASKGDGIDESRIARGQILNSNNAATKLSDRQHCENMAMIGAHHVHWTLLDGRSRRRYYWLSIPLRGD